MRILFLSNYYPPHEVGGYEQLCRDVAARLSERGHVTGVLTSDRGARERAPVDEPAVYRWLRLSPDYGSRLGVAGQFFLTRTRAEAHNRRCLRQVASSFAPDVVFVWNIQGLPRSIALEAESLPGMATAYWLAGYSPAEPDEYWLYWSGQGEGSARQAVKSSLSRLALSTLRAEGKPLRPEMRHVAVVSQYMRGKGLAEGTLPAHTSVIYNGVEVDRFYRPVQGDLDGPLCLMIAGRVSEDKGVHTAVEAVGRLVREQGIRAVRLQVAGSGPPDYLAQLQQLVGHFGIQEQVSFLGWLPRSEMPDLMAKCHALLLPTTHQEPFARVVLEGMAAGLAVVGTLTGGTSELLQGGVTGLAFDSGDSRDLATQIRSLVVEPGLRQRLAEQGQKQVLERFTLENMVQNIESFLEGASYGRL